MMSNLDNPEEAIGRRSFLKTAEAAAMMLAAAAVTPVRSQALSIAGEGRRVILDYF